MTIACFLLSFFRSEETVGLFPKSAGMHTKRVYVGLEWLSVSLFAACGICVAKGDGSVGWSNDQ